MAQAYKVDLHCHSYASPDSLLSAAHIKQVLANGMLDVVAVTDHDRIDEAQRLQAELGEAIIVGEEITSRDGEIIGLFLQEMVPPGLSASETVQRIRQQGGVVYIPHPFETVRKGLKVETLESIAQDVDIVEVNNGRSFSARAQARARDWVSAHNTAAFSSSDIHGRPGWGRIYTELTGLPTAETIVALARGGRMRTGRNGLAAYAYPKLARARKKYTGESND